MSERTLSSGFRPRQEDSHAAAKRLTDFSIATLIGSAHVDQVELSGCSPADERAFGRQKSSERLATSCKSLAQQEQLQLQKQQREQQQFDEERVQSKKLRPKNFQCPACKMAFSNNGQLKNHVRIHTGERPFECNHQSCNKSFTRNEELTRHKLIHTGVRPHVCTHCAKRFGRKDHLKKHVRTHERKRLVAAASGGAGGGSGHCRGKRMFLQASAISSLAHLAPPATATSAIATAPSGNTSVVPAVQSTAAALAACHAARAEQLTVEASVSKMAYWQRWCNFLSYHQHQSSHFAAAFSSHQPLPPPPPRGMFRGDQQK